ncbi:hypothetical protein [Burkholderia cenocepacia]|uniref:Uncharacterized protein n=1 Tax=Burkholderia cenocepacia TaxID=95486 RepID=A0A1V2W327_9BURK|nr:hypothetical protein [Burkholderia cenocepacia]MBR8248679.1 hypothetical protein [Burkholderia cenocepacia]MBR8288853.1 hypothetical protein [Burkholderia cenocepacia]MBR8497122.1 hypothetical protein [Burkholderia cenocepacia]MDN7456583.1 hypothetical protein [Burkholderia cenocepacia]ONJ13691.1 hypothetical protein A8D83_12035 [Burkholderia cenocepacia]
MDAIFRSTQQALHVAYLVMSEPVREKNGLRLTLIRIIESLGTLNKRQAAFLEYLYGSNDGTVNFSGLVPIEVRGQCAEVASAVQTKLSAREQWVILARFGQMGDERMPDGTVRIYFLKERSDAIQNLSKYLVGEFRSVSELAMDCIIARHYAGEEKAKISFRDLEKAFGASHMTYKRAYDAICPRLKALENGALDKLTEYFVRTGLVEGREQATA